MSPRSLFAVIIKIFGLFFLKELVNTLPQLFLTQIALVTEDDPNINLLIYTTITTAFYGCIVYLLLFKTNYFLDKLELEHAFEAEQFSFNLPAAKVLTIALIVIAGVILIQEIPNLLQQFYFHFKSNAVKYGTTEWDYSYAIVSVVKILIAMLLIGERKMIIDFIEKRQAKEQGDD